MISTMQARFSYSRSERTPGSSLTASFAGPRFQPVAASAAKTQTESPVVKFLISGGTAFAFELVCGHYIEFLKIVKQTKKGTYWQLTQEMVAQKGVIGIWDGYFPWGAVQAVTKGAVFGWGHAFSKRQLQPFVDNGYFSGHLAEIMAGGMGGGFQGIVLSPVLLLKTRVMTDPIFRTNMSLAETNKQSMIIGMRVIRNEGLGGLMKGSVVFSLKRVADWTTRFFFAETLEGMIQKRGGPGYKLSTKEKMFASSMGGLLSALSTIPIDVMVAQIQQASKAGQNVSVVETFRDEFKKGGVQRVLGFATRGFVARVAHVALTTMLMKTGASWVYEKMYGVKPKGH